MAAEIQKGTATLYGITNSGSAITISGFATFIQKGAKLAHKFKMTEIPDANGFTGTWIATDEHNEVDLEFHPSGATRAAAAAVAAVLAPFALVTLANFKVTAFNGDYQYFGDQSIDLSDTDCAKINLKIRKYADATQQTASTTVVTG